MNPPVPSQTGIAAPLGGRARIAKNSAARVPPNLADYDAACRDFSWAGARALLDGLPDGRGLNIAHEAVDRHAAGPRAGRAALRWIGRGGERVFTWRDLRDETNRVANALLRLGLGPGARVFDFSGKPMAGWVTVGPEGYASAEDLARWVGLGVAYAGSLPAK